MFQTPLTSPVASGGPSAIVLPPNPVRPFLNVCPNPLIQTSIHHGYYTPLGYGYQPPTSPSPVPSSTNQLPQVNIILDIRWNINYYLLHTNYQHAPKYYIIKDGGARLKSTHAVYNIIYTILNHYFRFWAELYIYTFYNRMCFVVVFFYVHHLTF